MWPISGTHSLIVMGLALAVPAWLAAGQAEAADPPYEEKAFAGRLEARESARVSRDPYDSAVRVESLQRGAVVEAMSRVTVKGVEWYRITRDGKPFGYVLARQVKELDTPTAAAQASASATPASTAANPYAARSSGSTGGSTTPDPIEMAFWDSVKDSRSPAELRAYLNKYPNGQFAEVARLRERELGQGAPAARPSVPEPRSPLTDPTARQGMLAALATQMHDWPFDGGWRGKIRRTELNDMTQRHNCPDATLDFTVAGGQVTYAKLNVAGLNMTFATGDNPGGALGAATDLARTVSKYGRLSIEGMLDKDGLLNAVKVRAYDFLGSNFINYTLTGQADKNEIQGRWRADLNACSGVFNFGRADGSAIVPPR